MKTRFYILIILIGFTTSAFSQIKIWDKNLKTKKIKGIISKLETPINEPIVKDSMAFVGAGTVAGLLIPYVIKYGNSALKKATSKNEINYKFEATYLNQQTFSFNSLSDSIVRIEAKQLFYEKGKSEPEELSSYFFNFTKNKNSLKIELDDLTEEYSLVKVKNKYDFIISNFDISLSAIVNQEIDSTTTQRKIIELGTTTIHKVNSNFKSEEDKTEIINSGGLLLPSITEKGKEIKIEQLIVKIIIKHINPYGTTSSGLNDFLEKNSETNEEFLNSIFIKKEEE
jgi:hypothetical protein